MSTEYSIPDTLPATFYNTFNSDLCKEVIAEIEDYLFSQRPLYDLGPILSITSRFVSICSWLHLPFGPELVQTVINDLDKKPLVLLASPDTLNLLRSLEQKYQDYTRQCNDKPAVDQEFFGQDPVRLNTTYRPYIILFSGSAGYMYTYESDDKDTRFTKEEADQIVAKLSGEGVQRILITKVLYEVSTVRNVIKFVDQP